MPRRTFKDSVRPLHCSAYCHTYLQIQVFENMRNGISFIADDLKPCLRRRNP